MLFARDRWIQILVLQVAVMLTGAAVAEDRREPFITEAYYRVEWGHFDEFMDLFKKNHYPILEKLQKMGLIESMSADFPINHASEDSRWDFRMTIVIPDTQAYALAMPAVSKELFPDQKKLAEQEQHRFSLLSAHTDVVIRTEDLSKW